MGIIKSKEHQKSELIHIESELSNLWGELNTANIPHAIRMDLEAALAGGEEELKAVLAGRASIDKLKNSLDEIDKKLAMASIQQAETEIPKAEHTRSAFLALQNIRDQFMQGKIKASRARHEVKEIMRPH